MSLLIVRNRCRSFRAPHLGMDGRPDLCAATDNSRRCRRPSPPESIEDTGDPEEIPEDVAFYRRRTEAMLRRYLRISLEVGKVPICLPREFLRARNVSRRGSSFEDGVIFVHDIERCIRRLDGLSVDLLTRIALQEYTHKETSDMLGMQPGKLGRSYDEALDALSAMFLSRGLMRRDA